VIVYRAFVAAIDGLDVDELAERAGVAVESIRAIAAGDVPPSLSVQMRLAYALDVNPLDLFRLDEHLEEALAGAPSRYVSDPATLRIVDRPRS
jgi:transcriptional regulator with XRE-family HTH domain